MTKRVHPKIWNNRKKEQARRDRMEKRLQAEKATLSEIENHQEERRRKNNEEAQKIVVGGGAAARAIGKLSRTIKKLRKK